MLRPSFLLGERAEVRYGERIAQAVINGVSIILSYSIRKHMAIHVRTVAQSMISAAKNNVLGIHMYDSSQMDELAKRLC